MPEEKKQEQLQADPLKLIIQSSCPKCKESLFIAYNVYSPNIEAILTAEDVKAAKEDMLKKIEDVKFNDKAQKELAVQWIKSENTIIGQSDVDKLIKSIVLSQDKNATEHDNANKNTNK